MRITVFFLLINIFLIPLKLYSQTSSDKQINSQFRIAVDFYSTGLPDQALSLFDKIINDYDYNSKTTVSEFFKAKIYLEQEKFDKAGEVLTSFTEKYPQSRYLDEINVMTIKYYKEVANYYNAFKESCELILHTKDVDYKNEGKTLGENIAAEYLNNVQLQRLYDSFTDGEVKSFVLLQLGKYYIRKGGIKEGKKVLLDLIEKYRESEEYAAAKLLFDSPAVNESSGSFHGSLIGIMLPLETNSAGEYQSQTSAEILEGIKYAVNEYNNGREDKVGLVMRDTKASTGEIEKIRDEFAVVPSIKAIIGPIYSSEVREALKDFESLSIPIISPTATDDDLTSISDNFFQANPSFYIRGKVMAQYIYYVENKRKISILNSIESYSPLLAATFAEEFEKLGGKIVRKETYRENTTSLSDPISRITADTLAIDGLYIPLSNNLDAPLILANLVRYNFKLPVYGNQDWLTAKGFETSPEISNNLTFTSDYFIDFNSNDYQEFSSQYTSVTGMDVNRNVLYGYDTGKYLLTVIRNIDPNHFNIKLKIESGITSRGFHNNISFDESRVNGFLNIVRYRNGVFELVDKFRLGD